MSYSQAEVYTSVNIRRVLTTCPYKILHELYTLNNFYYKLIPFLFQAILSENSTSGLVISKPKFSCRQKVVHAIIRSVGMCVRVRALVKNIMGMTTPVVKST